ncbi:MAG: hypothetical protein PVH19_14625 [Planctomycetia bacterium]|jgi:hypothetical protein
MTYPFKTWWEIILQKHETIQTETRMPLRNLEPYLAYYNLALQPFADPQKKTSPEMEIGDDPPSFKNLSETTLLALRTHLQTASHLDITEIWAEKLMRFCEIRYRTLKKRAMDKCKNLATAQNHLLHLMVFLLDYGCQTDDLRFFNIVLKMADLPWLVNPKTILTLLHQEDEAIVLALFQFRILLIKTYLLDHLYQGVVK